MRRFAIPVVLILCVVMMASCGKRYVGREIDMMNPYWCAVNSLPHTCNLGKERDAFFLSLTISKGETEGIYVAEGICDFSKGNVKSASHVITNSTRLSLLLAKDSVIVDNHRVVLRPMGTSKEVPFIVQFASPDGFDAVTVYGDVMVR